MSRKKCRRKHYALLDTITHVLAGIVVTPEADLDKLRMRELSAIEAFRTGSATREDWMAVADCLNICETLTRSGIGPEALEPCLQAQEALGAAKDRFDATGSFGVTGPQLQSLREAYEWHDAQRTAISRAEYERAIRTTANRIRSSHPSVKVMV